MIGSSTTGRGFGGLQRYLLEGDRHAPQDRVAWTATRHLAATDPELAAVQMRATAAQAPRVQKPVFHLVLSAPPGEELDRATWEKIAERVLTHLELADHQALLVAHDDTDHTHLHLMINRVHPERLRAWRDSFSHRRIQKALRHLERDLGLREVPGTLYQLPDQTRPDRSQTRSSGERQQAERTGEPAAVDRFRRDLRDHFLEARSWADLEARLAEHGVRLKPRGRGLVVTDGESQVKASRIHRRASIHQLEKRFGVSYREWRKDLARYQKRLGEVASQLEQRDELRQTHARLAAQVRQAERELSRHQARQRRVEAAQEALRRQFERLYRDPDKALAAFEAEHRTDPEAALERLATAPRAFGKLRSRRLTRESVGSTLQAARHLQATETQTPPSSTSPTRLVGQLHRWDVKLEQLSRRLDEVSEGIERDLSDRRLAHFVRSMGWKALTRLLPRPAARALTYLRIGSHQARRFEQRSR